MSDDDGGLIVSRITVERTLYPGGMDLVTVAARTGDGEDGLPSVEALGMLRLAESLLFAEYDGNGQVEER